MKSSSPRGPAPQAAAVLGCTMRKLRDLRAKRLVTTYRLGYRTILYDLSSLQEYLDHVRTPSRLDQEQRAYHRRHSGRPQRAHAAKGDTDA